MKIVSFFTETYREEVGRLIDSCCNLELDYDIREMPDRGTWNANCRMKVPYIIGMRLRYRHEPILWVDADGEMLRTPPPPQGCDVGVHFHKRGDGWPSPGTVYLAPTQAAWHFLMRWNDAIRPNETDQSVFNEAIGDVSLWRMPGEWCYIEGLQERPKDVIIQQHQASRRLKR